MNENASTETIAVKGTAKPVEIRIDRWGIAHIDAQNEHDLFFAQGFNAARDRLWQIDLWRKRGLGLLAADFGPGYLAQDHAARHFLYRGDMEAEWVAYAPDTQTIATAFVAGINAYVELCEAEPARLPPEFAFFGTKPARWEPADVVRIRSHALVRNGIFEILRANVMALADVETDLLRVKIDPPAEPKAADGLDLSDVSLKALQLFKLATAPVTFEADRLAAPLADAWKWTEVTDLGDIVRATEEEGSNNWVVAAARTSTGRPLLATDPHRAHAVPSLRYLVHLKAPGFNAIGTGEPAVPGISLGHNETVAFGLTIFGADQEDVYVYETRPDDPDRYRYGDSWEAFERVGESFAIKGHPDERLTLSFSRHGPVLYEDKARHRAIALRTVWTSPGSAAYLGSLSAMRATSVAGFGASLAHWGTPSVNHVVADVEGNIAWFTAGFTPVRPNWRGLLPVPGNGSHEWQGFIPADELPRSVNPEAGFLATANEMNLPANRPSDAPPISHEWAESSRAWRIKSVLAADATHSPQAAMALQTDTVSRPALRVCALLEQAVGRGPAGEAWRQAAALLQGWNGDLAAESAPAALYEVWWTKHLKPALLARFAPDPAVRKLLLPGDVDVLVEILETPKKRFGADAEKLRDALLLETLVAAFADCGRRLGADPSKWQWGRLHKAYFEHAASRAKGGDSAWDVGPLPFGGSRSTPMQSGYRVEDFRLTSGASVRMVMDVGAWDNSFCINTPGQSGDPRSLHYRDLAERWSKGGYVPLLYSPERIAEETTRRILLMPG